MQLNKSFQKYPAISSFSNISQDFNEFVINLNLMQISNLIDKHKDKIELTSDSIIVINIDKDNNYAQWIGFDIEYNEKEDENNITEGFYYDNILGILSLSDIGIKKIEIPKDKYDNLNNRKNHIALLKIAK